LKCACRAIVRIVQVIPKSLVKDSTVQEVQVRFLSRKEAVIVPNALFGSIMDCQVCITVLIRTKAEFHKTKRKIAMDE
jgi:hypothetical protein